LGCSNQHISARTGSVENLFKYITLNVALSYKLRGGKCPHMKKEERLVNKVKRLIRRAGTPRFLHRFGPKKFLFWKLALGLLI